MPIWITTKFSVFVARRANFAEGREVSLSFGTIEEVTFLKEGKKYYVGALKTHRDTLLTLVQVK